MDMKSVKDLLEKLEIQIGEPSKSILARMEPPRSIRKSKKRLRSPEQELASLKVKIRKSIYIAGTINKREIEAWLDLLLHVLLRSADMATFWALFTVELENIRKRKEQRRATKKVDGKKNLGV